MVLKGLIFNSFQFWRIWWSSKDQMLEGCGGLDILILGNIDFGRVWWSSRIFTL